MIGLRLRFPSQLAVIQEWRAHKLLVMYARQRAATGFAAQSLALKLLQAQLPSRDEKRVALFPFLECPTFATMA